MIWDTQAEPALTAIVAGLSQDDVGAVVCGRDGAILWQNAAAAGRAERLATLAAQEGSLVKTADGVFRISPLWAAHGALRLVRGPLDNRSDRLLDAVHDLRTPLQALAAAAEDAMADNDSKTVRIGALALDVLERLESVLDDLSQRIERPRDFAPIDVVLRLTEMLGPLCMSNGVTVDVRPPDRPMMIHGNATDFAAIVQNLLGNAIRHAGRGRVEVTLLPFEDMVALSVKDDGPGLPEDIARFVAEGIEPERHLHGLRIARERVAAMDGTLQHIPHAAGVEFRALLPGRLTDEPLRTGAVVVIVEDNPVNAEIFAGIVRGMGAVPQMIARGTDVPSKFGDAVAAVLLDVSLPDISGLEVARRIRSAHPELPVLGITGHAETGMREACLQAGMSDVVIKPVRAAELRFVLSHLVCNATLLDKVHFQEMADDLGPATALDFLRRALDESEALLTLLSTHSADPEALVHSATGSAGMTGLVALERELRHAQRLLRDGLLPEAPRLRLAVILRQSRTAVERLPTGSEAAPCS